MSKRAGCGAPLEVKKTPETVNLNGLQFERKGEKFYCRRNAKETYELRVEPRSSSHPDRELWVGSCTQTGQEYMTPTGNLGTAVDWVAEQLFKGGITYEKGKLSIDELDLEPTSDPRVFTLSALRRRYDLEITDREAPAPSVDVTRHELNNGAGWSFNTIAEAIRCIKKEVWDTRLTIEYHAYETVSLDLNYGEQVYDLDMSQGRELETNAQFYDALGSPELERLDQAYRDAEGQLSDKAVRARYKAWLKAIDGFIEKHGINWINNAESGEGLLNVGEWRDEHNDDLL